MIKHRQPAARLAPLLGFVLCAIPALAAEPGLQGAPLYNFGTDPFAQGAPAPASVPPGTIALVPTAPSNNVSAYLRNVHGYVAAGVATGGGAGVSAGAILPLVPGKLDLTVSGGAGQIGNLPRWRGASGTAPYHDYQATLDYHAENFDAAVSVGGGSYPWLHPYAR